MSKTLDIHSYSISIIGYVSYLKVVLVVGSYLKVVLVVGTSGKHPNICKNTDYDLSTQRQRMPIW